MAETDHFVYVMSCEGRTKIGMSNNVRARRRGVETASGMEVTLHGEKKFPNKRSAGEAERSLHGIFSSSRLHGEWFSIPAADALAALLALPDAPEPEPMTEPMAPNEYADHQTEWLIRRLETIAKSGRRQRVGSPPGAIR